MGYTVEDMGTPSIPNPRNEPNQFDLPSKEFIGYDRTTAPKPASDADKKEPEPKQADKPEADIPTEPAKAEDSVSLSPKISALARKEQAQRQREAALKRREQELETKLADAEKYAQLKAKLASKDYSAADELGMSYEEYTQYLVDKQAQSDPQEERYRKVESEIENLKKQKEEETVREYQENQMLWKQAISELVDKDEAYSTIKELNSQDKVLQHINDSFDEDGVELTAEQAAKEIEDALVKRAEKFASVTKIKKKFEAEPKVLGPPKTSPKTITQNMTTTSVKPSSKPFHLMNESEQLAEAIRRVNEQRLKQRG